MDIAIRKIESGGVSSPRGFFSGATFVGLKKESPDALDLAVLYSEENCAAAGVFTTNKIKAAPVILDQKRIQINGKARAVIINSGCANACTGEQGMKDAEKMAALVGKSLGISSEEVMVASTGVIGVALPMDKIEAGVAKIILSRDGGHNFTRAIMTTDTRPKEIAFEVSQGGTRYTIGGTAKGAGMIHPNMATMLCFLSTDAAVNQEFLQAALKNAVDISFNMVTVDGDTSTNDTVLLLANGMAENPSIDQKSELGEGFKQALDQVCNYLAKSIAKDGEGATRLIEITVDGAASLADARVAARTIAGSSLVKSAVHGCDPNWGRIAAAAGRSGARVDEEKLDVYIGEVCLLHRGRPLPFDKKTASAILDREEVILRVDLNIGEFSAVAWGCDLSEEYVVINAEYTT